MLQQPKWNMATKRVYFIDIYNSQEHNLTKIIVFLLAILIQILSKK